MNQEQVDVMCPEERRRREEVKREVSDASWGGHDAFQSKDPVVEGCLVRQWREMDEGAFYPGCWVSLLTIWGGLKTRDRHLKRNIHQVAMKM